VSGGNSDASNAADSGERNNDAESARSGSGGIGNPSGGNESDSATVFDATNDGTVAESDAGDSQAGSGGTAGLGTSSAKAFAARLGRSHFMIGMGNDLADNHNQDGAYTLGVTLDLHYAYLVGLPGQGGWPDWNVDGAFVNMLTDTAKNNGVNPMFTLYAMAAWGEADLSVLTNDDYMGPYWDGAKLLFERIALFGDPTVVHFEPDFWAYAQQQSGNDPESMPVHVSSLANDCADQPDNLVGMGRCLVELARKHAPNCLVGFHASVWASNSPESTGDFLVRIGAGEADFVAIDMLDRDAGCFEAAIDPNCQRGTTGFYWDETNQTSPNFHEHLAWSKTVGETVDRPVLWWQVPFGVPSATPGGTPGHYRDNRVKYIFEHIDEFIEAGGAGVAFGVGAANQTYIDTDGGQFKDAVTKYFQSPTPL